MGSASYYLKHQEKEKAESRADRLKIKLLCLKYKGNECVKCGYNKNPSSMQFHHQNPEEKDFNICSYSRKYKIFDHGMMLELDKCILLCSNCHSKEHNSDRSVMGINPIKDSNICEYYKCTNFKRENSKFCSVSHLSIATARKRRFRLMDEAYKSKGDKCELCGETHRSTFVFHHNSDKEFTLSNSWNFSEARIKLELEKCILLCQNCHRELHS